MIERRYAHPVIDATLLDAAPMAVRLLSADVVLWRDGDGAPRAALDRCPHRGTRLSLGQVRDGELECAYHGWRFAGSGRCVAIPAQPGFAAPASHALTMLPLVEAMGLVWLQWAGDSASVPAFEAEADPRLRKLNVGPYDVATSAPRIVENFLDLAHFAFVHDNLLGDRRHSEVAAYRVSVDATGVHAQGCRAWQPQSNRLSTLGSWVDYDYDVPAPFAAVLRKAPDAQAGYRESIALFLCPVEPEASRVWFRMAVPEVDGDDEALRRFQHQIFAQDQPVLESQRPRLLPLAGAELHGPADRSSVAYRRYLKELGVNFGTC